MSEKRIETIENLLDRYYKSEDSFVQTELAIEIIQSHLGWLMGEAKKVTRSSDRANEAERENQLLYGRLNNIISLANKKIK